MHFTTDVRESAGCQDSRLSRAQRHTRWLADRRARRGVVRALGFPSPLDHGRPSLTQADVMLQFQVPGSVVLRSARSEWFRRYFGVAGRVVDVMTVAHGVGAGCRVFVAWPDGRVSWHFRSDLALSVVQRHD